MAEHRIDPAEIPKQRAMGWPDFHPETFCHECGSRNVHSWAVDGEMWDKVMRGDDYVTIVCPPCFDAHARKRGITGTWMLTFMDGKEAPQTPQPPAQTQTGADS